MNRYSWDAEDYVKHSSVQHEWAKELIPKLRLSGDETLLDIGCGDGRVTAVLAACLPRGHVVGIDSSEEMISLASRSYPKDRYPNLFFQRMDARELTFRERFDCVFSNATLHWVIDHRPVLYGVNRSLKKSGRLLFQMGGKGNAEDIIAVLDELINEDRWKPFFDGFSFPYGFYEPKEYKTWLCQAGLKPERVELLPKDMKHSGREGLAGWIRTTWMPYTERVPTRLRDSFITEIVDRYLKAHPLDEMGTACVKMVRLEVEASKP
jgi:trans-aconitate methyltransferase